MTPDVLVVGGGPAGTVAAWEAATADPGADVVVLEAGVPREERDAPGPDSTDAAGLLDYWRDLAGLDDELLSGLVAREIDRVDFVSPGHVHHVRRTGIESTYDHLAYTFDRVGLDDRLRERAERAGVDYRTGTRVSAVDTAMGGDGPTHHVTVAGGGEFAADALVLADGPKRRATIDALSTFLDGRRLREERLAPGTVNHVAYQEYRRFPDGLPPEVERTLTFWWGAIPGETAYLWVFPGRDDVARVGLTMPTGLALDEVADPEAYPLLRERDDRLPRPSELVCRLLDRTFGGRYDVEADLPLADERGKNAGTEGYQISSMPPIDSPVAANVAVVGGAMGATSAFHEGGYHTAVATGRAAGRLAATGDLARYNDRWKAAIGDEILRNLVFAEVFGEHTPGEWAETFRLAGAAFRAADAGPLGTTRIAGRLLADAELRGRLRQFLAARSAHVDGGLVGQFLGATSYDFVAIRESEYEYP